MQSDLLFKGLRMIGVNSLSLIELVKNIFKNSFYHNVNHEYNNDNIPTLTLATWGR